MSKSKISKWRQYEWLVSKIFHDSNSSYTTKVIGHSYLRGQYSDIPREIDILVESKEFKTIIECKHHQRPVDIKNIESFLGMFSDVNADFGILVSSSGFTKSVLNRIREFNGKITLEYLDWDSAYSNSFNEESYGRISDLCNKCLSTFERGKEIPGLLLWELGFGIEFEGKNSIYYIGKCLKCNEYTVYCDPCGWVTLASDETCCNLRDVFIDMYTEKYVINDCKT